jgi:hypothetical protein
MCNRVTTFTHIILIVVTTKHVRELLLLSPDFHNPLAGFSLLILEASRSHTMTHHSR